MSDWFTNSLKALTIIFIVLLIAYTFTWTFSRLDQPSLVEVDDLRGQNYYLERENKDLHELLDNVFPLNLIYFYDSTIRLGLLLLIMLLFLREIGKPYFGAVIKKVTK